jgi:hypothetical protein
MFGICGTIFGNIVGERPSASVAAAAYEREDRVLGATRVPGGRVGGLPVRTFEAVPGVPPVSVLRFPYREERTRGGHPVGQAHTHDFLALTYFERGGGSLRLGEREWSVEAGDAYVFARAR